MIVRAKTDYCGSNKMRIRKKYFIDYFSKQNLNTDHKCVFIYLLSVIH